MELSPDNKRRFKGSPHGEVAAVLLGSQRAVANLKHVPVVVTPEVGRVPEEGGLVDYVGDAPTLVPCISAAPLW